MAEKESETTFRSARESDLAEVLRLICELAEYERLRDDVVATEDSLHTALFGARPTAEVLLAECDGRVAGFALFFHNFSSFLGRPGLYLEDIFVRPAFRRRGIGREFFRKLAQIAVERKCGRMEWSVLDWNEPALAFYESLGARPMSEWTVQRLAGDALLRAAENP